MPVCSNWKVTLDPGGGAERVILDFGQRMEEEIVFPWSQEVDSRARVRAANVRHFARGNAGGRLTLSVFDAHLNDAAARNWMLDLHAALTADFANASNLTATIEVQGGNTYDLSNVIIASAEPRMRVIAGEAQTVTAWAIDFAALTVQA